MTGRWSEVEGPNGMDEGMAASVDESDGLCVGTV